MRYIKLNCCQTFSYERRTPNNVRDTKEDEVGQRLDVDKEKG